MRKLPLVFFDVKVIDYAPQRCVHTTCQTECPRRQRRQRTMVDRGTELPCLLSFTVGVYHCPTCGRHWTLQPPNARPHALYTESVRALGVASIDHDGMPIRRVVHRLERDFGLKPCHTTARQWWLDQADSIDVVSIEAKVTAQFSGVLALDEVYDRSFAILVATDPLQNCELGYFVGRTLKAQQVEQMCAALAQRGINPAQIVTDESKLYPKVLAKVWPKAKHALCHFHMSRQATQATIKTVNQIHAKMPKPPKRRRGRPKRRGRPRLDKAKRQARKLVRQSKYLMVKRREKMTDEEVVQMCMAMITEPKLVLVRCFMDTYYNIMEGNPTPKQTRSRRDEFVALWSKSEHEELAKFARKLGQEEVWSKLEVPLYFENGVKTSNHVERDNRAFRKRQKSHYRLRSGRSIEALRKTMMESSAEHRTDQKLRYRFGRYAGEPVRNVVFDVAS